MLTWQGSVSASIPCPHTVFGTCLNIKTVFQGMGILIHFILICNPYNWKDCLYIEIVVWPFNTSSHLCSLLASLYTPVQK